MTRLIDLYHRTTRESAESILRDRRMSSRENIPLAYFSTRLDGQAMGYGQATVHVRVPVELASLDDEFPDGGRHYTVHVARLKAEHFIAVIPQ